MQCRADKTNQTLTMRDLRQPTENIIFLPISGVMRLYFHIFATFITQKYKLLYVQKFPDDISYFLRAMCTTAQFIQYTWYNNGEADLWHNTFNLLTSCLLQSQFYF